MPQEPESVTIDLSTDGYTSVSHPGPAFRPIPEFSFAIPPGWVTSEFAEALCFIGPPESADGPWSNVFLQHERVLPTTALEEVAVETWDQILFDFPDAVLIDERIFEFEQYQYVRECELTVADELVTRLDSYWFGPDVDHVTVDLFHLIALHPVEAGAERTAEYLRMLHSFRFTGLTPGHPRRPAPRTEIRAEVKRPSRARRTPLVARPRPVD